MQFVPPSGSVTPLLPKAGAHAGRIETASADTLVLGYQIRTLKTIAEIEEFRQVWADWQSILSSDVDFYLTLIGAQTPMAQPHVTVLLSEGIPKALLVGYLSESTLDFKISYKSLFRARIRTLAVVTGGLLGDQSPDAALAAVSVLMRELRRGNIEALIVDHSRTDSHFYRALRKATSVFTTDHSVESAPHWKMDVRETIEEVYAGLSGDHRRKLRWQNKNFEKSFPEALRIHCFRETSELEQMVKDVEEIASKTYQRALGSSFVDSEFNRRRITLEARQGWLRMYVLYINEKPAAYWWATLYKGVFFSEAMGFDTEHRKYSPGIYLLSKALEELCQNKIKELDFGYGDYLYKRQFGNQSWEETTVFYVFAPKLRPIVLNIVRTLLGQFRFFSKALLQRLQVHEWIQKLGKRALSARA